MYPTQDEIQRAAYLRWLARGGSHGHDRDDWWAAEQDLLFALNYRVIARYRLDAEQPHCLGNAARRVCRFCEQSAPRTTFSSPRRVLPAFAGGAALLTDEECDECHDAYRENLEPELERFLRPLVSGEMGAQRAITAAAFKGLVKIALTVLPGEEAAGFGDAIEWVANPDHDLDLPALGPLDVALSRLPTPAPVPWLALAQRVEDDAPLPSVLLFLVSGHVALQAALPLGLRDEELDGERRCVPLVGPRVTTELGHDTARVERIAVTHCRAPVPLAG
jgi:hypothetical protein